MTGAKLPIPIDFDRFRAGNIVLFGGSHYMVDEPSLYQKAFELWPTRIEMILVPAPDVAGTPSVIVDLPVVGDTDILVGNHAYQVNMWHREPDRVKLGLVRASWRDPGAS